MLPVPVRFDECEVPPWDLGDGRTLDSLPAMDVSEQRFEEGAATVAEAVRKITGPEAVSPIPASAEKPTPPSAAPASSAVGQAPSGEGLAHAIRNARFSTTRMRSGYDEREVDQFLDEVAEAVLEPEGKSTC